MSDPGAGDRGLTESELFQIAAEVGLSESHVRQALTDVRSDGAAGGLIDRVFGPSTVRASRVVPGTPEALGAELDDFLVASQLLQPVRRGKTLLQYRPAVDWASQLARAASFTSRKHYMASAKSVEIRLEAVDERTTLVEIEVDPGMRREDIAGVLIGGGVGAGSLGVLAGWGLSMVTPVGVAVAVGLLVGGGVWTGLAHAGGSAHKRKLHEVRSEIEGVLDALETGASLEPPPASWRRWVKRHFHGVARDLIRDDDD